MSTEDEAEQVRVDAYCEEKGITTLWPVGSVLIPPMSFVREPQTLPSHKIERYTRGRENPNLLYVDTSPRLRAHVFLEDLIAVGDVIYIKPAVLFCEEAFCTAKATHFHHIGNHYRNVCQRHSRWASHGGSCCGSRFGDSCGWVSSRGTCSCCDLRSLLNA